MPSPPVLGAPVVKQVRAHVLTCNLAPAYISVKPTGTTVNPRAAVIDILPLTGQVHMAIDAIPNTAGLNAAVVDTLGVRYIVGPHVQTIGLISGMAASNNVAVYIRAGVPQAGA